MAFMLRDMREEDLDQCLALTTDRFLYDMTDLATLRRMWTQVIGVKSGTASIIIDATTASTVAWFGVAVFVTDERAQGYHRLARPAIAHAMVRELKAGGRPFLSRDEIACANADGHLNLVVTHHGYKEHYDESDEKLRAASYDAALRDLSCWNVRSYTNEIFAQDVLRDGKQMGEANGFRVKRYTDEQLRVAGIPVDKAPWVWLATREDATGNSALDIIFLSFSPPRFGFAFREQDVLQLALDGHTEESIAAITGSSLSTVKKRFRMIYQRVHDADAHSEAPVFAESSGGAQGVETRRRLLDYLRTHREELRPYHPSAQP